MSVVLPLVRVALALVFATAAAAKLADRAGFAGTLESFGLSRRLAPAGSLALPLAELGVAALLLPAATSRWAAVGALVLLAAFCAAIARVLARGEQVDCGCFGSARSTSVGARALVRNGVLAALAFLVVAAGPGRALGSPEVPA